MAKRADKRREEISKKIKALRTERTKLSYEKFALENNFDPRQYYRIENNETNFTINSLLRILDIHKMTLEEFFKGL